MKKKSLKSQLNHNRFISNIFKNYKKKSNNKENKDYEYYYCKYRLEGSIINTYKACFSVKDLYKYLDTVIVNFKLEKGYDNVDFEILEFKKLTKEEYIQIVEN